jgi:predicted acyl esterase
MLRAWMAESVRPAPYQEELPGRWIAAPSWPPQRITVQRLHLTDDGLRTDCTNLTPRPVCSPQTVGKDGGSWCPFGRASDQAGDQREDDSSSLVFETEPLESRIEILGAAIVTLEIACNRSLANLAVRLCDVHPDGASLRVSFGILNLAHCDGSETPALLVPGRRYRVRIQLNDAGVVFPQGHRIRLALSTAYWPMVWPSRENATVTVFGGTLDLPVRPPDLADTLLPSLPKPETAPPEPVTVVSPGVVRIDRIGLELGTEGSFRCHVEDNDPLSAVTEMRYTQRISRDAWRTRIETCMRLSCTYDAFLLQAAMQAWDGDAEVCRREWATSVPRDFA